MESVQGPSMSYGSDNGPGYCTSRQEVHYVEWKSSLYNAELCTVTTSQEQYISGYNNLHYTYNIFSDLKANVRFIKVFMDGYYILYKEINGELGTDGAFLVDEKDIENGHPKPESNLFHKILRRRSLAASPQYEGTTITWKNSNLIGEPFDERCTANVVFEDFMCVKLKQVKKGKCRIIDTVYQFMADEDGQIDGIYVSKDHWQPLPANMGCDSNCVSNYGASVNSSDLCKVKVFYDELGNVTNQTAMSNYNKLVDFSKAEDVSDLIIIIIIAIALLIGVFLIVRVFIRA
jgi:hypothetical protein